MKVLFNDFKKQYKTHQKEIDTAIKRVLNSGWYILGKEVENFEKKFSSYIGTKETIGVANGMEALQIILLALNVGKGDEVITTPHSAIATSLAIQAVGAKPIFVDIDDFYHIDASKIEKHINKKTKAILPVHLYGQSVDIKKMSALAKKYKLFLIEDCAQAHGAKFKGKKVGTFGDAGAFSFYPTKNLGAFGDAGAIVTNNLELALKCRTIRNYGQKNRYEHEVLGLNSRLDELQAAILGGLLPNLEKDNSKRISVAKIYKKELSRLKEIKLPKERKDVKHVYHLFVIEAEKKDALQKFLKENGIETLIHYPIPIHKQKCFNDRKTKLPIIESKVSDILSLPIHPHLTKKEVLYVCQKIKYFYKQHAPIS